MTPRIELVNGLFFKAYSESGNISYYDSPVSGGGNAAAPSPMEALLTSLASCASIDVISILKKKRKTIENFAVEIKYERATEHPKVYTSVHLTFKLKSNDAQIADLERSIELSMEKYCSVSAMFDRSGCKVTTEAIIESI